MNSYGVGDIFQNIQYKDAMEGYANMTVDQIDNSFFRDMYMDTMEATLTGEDIAHDEVDDAMESAFGADLDNDIMMGLPPVNETTECGDGSCGEPDCPGLKKKKKDEGTTECGSACKEDTAYFRALNNITDSDPTDAGTFFNLKDKKTTVESTMDVDDIRHKIEVLPETELFVSESTAPEPTPIDKVDEVSESADLGLDILGLDLDI